MLHRPEAVAAALLFAAGLTAAQDWEVRPSIPVAVYEGGG